MIALVLAMARSRIGQLVTMLALATAAIATATSVPLFLAAADRSLVGTELAAATPAEQLVSASAAAPRIGDGRDRDRRFQSLIPAALSKPGFRAAFAAEFTATFFVNPGSTTSPAQAGTDRTGDATARFVYRDEFCAHVTMVSGRCPVAAGEVVVGIATAEALAVGAGSTLGEQEIVQLPDGPAASGPVVIVSVVGVYRPIDQASSYWAGQSYFDAAASPGHFAEPVFAARITLDVAPHGNERQSVEARLVPGAVRADRIPALRTEVAAMRTVLGNSNSSAGQVSVTTHIPDLLTRIERDRATLRSAVPVAAVPLVVLAWLGFFLAVSATTAARRDELGLLKLRGVSVHRRWGLALGESLLAIVLGTPLGYLMGVVLVRGLTAVAVPGAVTVPLDRRALTPVALAVAGLVVAAVIAQRRTFAVPVVELLRRVAARGAGWRGLAAEAVVVALAVAAVYQARSAAGPLTGVAQAATGLIVLAVAVLGARLLAPAIRWVGTRALRRGRLGLGLAGVRLARRPGLAALLAVLVVALGQLGFATVAGTVADDSLSRQVRTDLGAARVIDVVPESPSRLLAAVRGADPSGRYAMATALLPAQGNAPATLAVDASRLGAVATWLPDYGPVDVATAMADLHPTRPGSITIPLGQFSVDATVTSFDAHFEPHLLAFLQSLVGGSTSVVDLGSIAAGRHTYQATASECGYGCRLAALRLGSTGGSSGYLDAGVGAFDLVLHTVTTGGKSALLTGWHAPVEYTSSAAPTVTEGADGLAVTMTDTGLGSDPRVLPGDFAYPLPAVTSIRLPSSVFLSGLVGTPQPVHQVGLNRVLPGIGGGAVMIDLESADRLVASAGANALTQRPQVWISAGAPADLVDKLKAAGLTVTGEHTAAELLRYQHRQGPGLALRYHYFAAGLALVIAIGVLLLTAAVDRRSDELAGLRTQGVPDRVLRHAARDAALLPVLVAVVLGAVATVLAWVLTGPLLPVSVDPNARLVPPTWPVISLPLVIFPLAGLGLIAIAMFTAYGRDRSRIVFRGRT